MIYMTNEEAIEYLFDIKTDVVYNITTEEEEAINMGIKALQDKGYEQGYKDGYAKGFEEGVVFG